MKEIQLWICRLLFVCLFFFTGLMVTNPESYSCSPAVVLAFFCVIIDMELVR
jgi:hypothetical protein